MTSKNRSDEINLKKEKIINILFSKNDLNRIYILINEDNYILNYLWNYLNKTINEFAKNHKENRYFTNDEIKLIFLDFSEILKNYLSNFENKDSESLQDRNYFKNKNKYFYIKIFNIIETITNLINNNLYINMYIYFKLFSFTLNQRNS